MDMCGSLRLSLHSLLHCLAFLSAFPVSLSSIYGSLRLSLVPFLSNGVNQEWEGQCLIGCNGTGSVECFSGIKWWGYLFFLLLVVAYSIWGGGGGLSWKESRSLSIAMPFAL